MTSKDPLFEALEGLPAVEPPLDVQRRVARRAQQELAGRSALGVRGSELFVRVESVVLLVLVVERLFTTLRAAGVVR